jgi:hypothetical protein
MTLRIMLLGLVASMGIELPSGAEVTSWTRSGRDWVAATWADLPGSCVGADPADAGPTDCHQASKQTGSPVIAVAEDCRTSDDMVFEAVSEGMAADFSADLLTMQAEESPSETAAVMLSSDEPPAVGLPDGEESMTLAVPADEAEAVEPDEETDESPSHLDRVSSAVRLTREAVQAWASLIQESAEEGCASY